MRNDRESCLRVAARVSCRMPSSRCSSVQICAGAALAFIAACHGPAPAAPPGPRVYVSDETGTEVVVVDPVAGSVLQKIAIGKRPRGIKLSPDASKLFVALSGSPIGGPGVDESKLPPADCEADGIGVIDVAGGSVVRKYKSGQDSQYFAVSKEGRVWFVLNEGRRGQSELQFRSS